MGIFNSVIMYRTDGGIVKAVDEMDVTHLMNAIMHHNKQINLLEDMIDRGGLNTLTTLKVRVKQLRETVEVLERELISRDPADDPERHPKGEDHDNHDRTLSCY